MIEEVTAHVQSFSFEDAREICADGTYSPNNLRILQGYKIMKLLIIKFPLPNILPPSSQSQYSLPPCFHTSIPYRIFFPRYRTPNFTLRKTRSKVVFYFRISTLKYVVVVLDILLQMQQFMYSGNYRIICSFQANFLSVN